jgi:hypothetical protein
MPVRRSGFLVTALCIGAGTMLSPQASALTGAELYRFCSQPPNSDADLVCKYYIRGFTDGLTVSSFAAKSGKHQVCAPDQGIHPTQARLLIEKFLRDHPAMLHAEAGYLALFAFHEAFPCKPPN